MESALLSNAESRLDSTAIENSLLPASSFGSVLESDEELSSSLR